MDSNETIQKIVSASGRNMEEVQRLVNDKKNKFAGLLTDSGAALMVAKELDIELGLDKQPLERLSIGQLKEGMGNVELLVRAKQIFSPKNFERDGKRGVLQKVVVADNSGEMRLTVWGKDVERLLEEKVERGAVLLLKNCFVSLYKDSLELNLSYNGTMEVCGEGDAKGLPLVEEKRPKLKELAPGESDVSVVARALRIFPEKSFESSKGKGRLVNFLLGDETATIRATAWHDMADAVKGLSPGTAVKIEGAYTKEGLKGVELQLGWRARILPNPSGTEQLPHAAEIGGIEFKEKKIAGLNEGDRFVQLKAIVADVLPGNLRFNVCPKCGKKVDATGGGFLCNECGEVKPDIRAVVSLQLKDASGEISAVLFAELAEKAIGLDRGQLKKRLEVNTAEQLIAEIREKIAGKKVVASGFVKKNSFSSQLEFSVKEIEFE